MNTTRKALNDFFSSFGLPAYLSDTLPNDVRMPYITFDLVEPEALNSAMFTASIWYRDTSTDAVSHKSDEIRDAIGRCLSLSTDSGAIYIYPGSPFSQLRSDPNPETKRALLTMTISCDTV